MIKHYFFVTKPGIILGNIITAAGGFLLAAGGRFDAADLLWTLAGISLIVASGCVLNNCCDRHVDRMMRRTRHRALARGLMSPAAAVRYAALLGLVGAALLWATTPWLTVAIAAAGWVIYAGIYSLYLKRRSVYATLVGSLAGAAPPLAGYCAASHRFDTGALILLSIFSLWQIPHSYAIAVFRYDDYAAAAIPVLPVSKGLAAAKKHILAYIVAFSAAALMPTIGGYTGFGYFAAAAATGASWLGLACWGYQRQDNRGWARRLFIFSILGITTLAVMMSVDFRARPASRPVIPRQARAQTIDFRDLHALSQHRVLESGAAAE